MRRPTGNVVIDGSGAHHEEQIIIDGVVGENDDEIGKEVEKAFEVLDSDETPIIKQPVPTPTRVSFRKPKVASSESLQEIQDRSGRTPTLNFSKEQIDEALRNAGRTDDNDRI